MGYSQALQNAKSFQDVVEVINDGGTSFHSSNEIAGQYAHSAATEVGYGVDASSIEAHLDFLVEAGAEFDYAEASKIALEI